MRRIVIGVALGLVGLGVGAAQMPEEAKQQEQVGNGGLNHMLHAAPVTGQPFSAEQVRKKNRKLDDGTGINNFGHHFVARDSAGRVRVEQPCGCPDGHEQVIEVYIVDPVAQTLTTWRTGGQSARVATVTKMPKVSGANPAPVAANRPASALRPMITMESLPMETIDNLPMKVTKITTVVPAGRSHNDAPITKTDELWTSEDLKLTFREEWVDPRTGVRTVELAKFTRAEPDPQMFRPPAGYQVKDVKQMAKELADKLGQF
jgi:hypothetical protein